MIRFLAIGVVLAASLYGQRVNWQNNCFNNPTLPYCIGHEDAIKPRDRNKNAATGSGGAATSDATPFKPVVNGMDWRFADPLADAVVEFNLSGLSGSPLARALIAQVAAHKGLSPAALDKKFEGLTGVERVALSIRDGRIVIMMTGTALSPLPALDAGWKSAPVKFANAVLVGNADAVDAAMQRITTKVPLPQAAREYDERQAVSDFWASGSAAFISAEAASAGLKQFWLTASLQNRLATDAAFEFTGTPKPDAPQLWPALGDTKTEGNVFHILTSLEAADAQQRFGQIAGSPLSQRLEALITSGHYLPVRDLTELKKTKPVIYGLDNGPQVVN